VSVDGGASWSGAGGTAGAATMGTLMTPFAARGSALLDLESAVEVELLHDGMWLESRDDAALAAGANLAAVGSELLQFGVAEQLGARRFRLTRLLRGRRGSEWAASHQAGEGFVLVAAETLAAIEVPEAAVGGEARLLATGIGDGPDGVSASVPVTGEALRPPSPVHLRGSFTPAGDFKLAWVRRSRSGWTWISGADTPLGEEREAYRVTVAGTWGSRTAEVPSPVFTYSAAQQAADGAAPPFTVEVVQLGSSASSRPARLTAGA
jgi:hypothetical protein